MPGRSLWSGTIGFGLVAIPVNIVPAVTSSRASFHLLHDADHARLQRQMVCPKDDKPVEIGEMVRGFEIEPDKYVTVTEKELESVEPKRSRNIDILDFVDANTIDPIYYDRPYYLTPTSAEKPYRLLVEALNKSKKVGIAKFVMHEREYVVALRSLGNALCLMTLRYGNEILSNAEMKPRESKVAAKDLKMMEGIIKKMSRPFKASELQDDYNDKVKQLIERIKKKEGTVKAPGEKTEELEQVEPMDLVAALEKSMAQAKPRGKTQSRKSKPAASKSQGQARSHSGHK